MPHNALPVYDVSHPTGEDPKGVPNAIELPDLPSLVAQEGEGQGVLFGKTSVGLHRIRAYSDDFGIELPKFLVVVPEGTSLFGAAGGIVLGVEEEDYRLLAEEAL